MKLLVTFCVILLTYISTANAGSAIIKGRKLTCPGVKVIVKPLGEEGYAYLGVMFIDPKLGSPTIFYHECAHAKGVRSEARADCIGMRLGRGKITMADIERDCRILRNDPASRFYPSGKKRCQIMKKCFRK